jgi:predicted amidohydrolase
MRNPQVDFMMRVRARENGLWIAAADKAGSENAAVHYVGKSLIVAPDGAVAAIGPATGSAIVTADVVRRAAAPYVARLSARERRILAAMPRPLSKGTTTPGPQRIGVLQGPMGRLKSAALRTLAAQGAGAFIDTAQSARAIAGGLQRLRGLRCAVIAGLRMLAPEPARAAALQGADLIVWARPPRDELVTSFARTRALESRVYVIACCRAGDPQPACVVDPSGAIVAEALAGTPSAFVVAIDTAQSRDKLVVPGTDAFAARVPRAFEPLEAAPR